MVVLDNSGSMKKNDPDALMGQAVSVFAAHLSADSRLGIVIFDQGVHPALGLTLAGGLDFEVQVTRALRGINYRGQWTDIPGGVERGLYELRERMRSAH
ncbi:MAG: VWA domain-containing protein [Burkholderiales bacterium]